jgi:hypothetical protein
MVNIMTNRPLAERLAWCALPTAGFSALVASGDRRTVRIVAANQHTPEELRRQLAGWHVTARYALARTTDRALLTAVAAARSIAAARGVAANPHTEPQLLADLVTHPSEYVRYAAAGNPVTPTKAIASGLAQYGGVLQFLGKGATAVAVSGRSGRVIRHHPDLAEAWLDATNQRLGRGQERLGAARRCVARIPHLDPHLVRAFLARPRTAGRDTLAANPTVADAAFDGKLVRARARLRTFMADRSYDEVVNADHGTLLDAIQHGYSRTLDFGIAQRPDLSVDVARAFFTTERSEAGVAEADILAELVDRFGPDVAVQGRRSISGVRWAAVTDLCLLADEAADGPLAAGRDRLACLAATLGDNSKRWEIFLKLSTEWTGSIADLFYAARNL